VAASARVRVYAVRNLPPETWAVLAAWYSRSPNTLRGNLLKAIAEGTLPLPDALVANGPTEGEAVLGAGDLDYLARVTRPDTHTAAAIVNMSEALLSDPPPAFAGLAPHVPASLQDDSDDLAPIRQDRTVPVFVREGYDSLFTVLTKALHQAQDGKGAERHSNGLPFDQQPIIVIGQLAGMGFQTGQAIKKAVEAQGMVKRGDFAAAEREILGAVNYLAAVAIEINRRATAASQ
jgi:hypothetical protein